MDYMENKKMVNILVLISSNSVQIKLDTFSESMCSYETKIDKLNIYINIILFVLYIRIAIEGKYFKRWNCT